jgi:DUF4097 and DUF4098 domain-containing protein YvlB
MTATPTDLPTRPYGDPGPPSDTSRRTAVRVVVIVLSLLLVAWGALSLVSVLARESLHRSATYAGVRTVELDLGFESVTVTGDDSASRVSMERTAHWSMSKPDLSSRVEGNHLLMRSSCHWSVGLGCSGDVRLVVPSGTVVRVDGSDGHVSVHDLTSRVEVATSDGGIDVSGITGGVVLHTGDGRIEARDVTGPVELQTSDGSIEATSLRSPTVDARTSDGSVRLDFATVPRRVSARTGDGSVEVAVPRDGAPWQVDATTGDGSRVIDVATDPAADRAITVHTGDGSVRVHYTP